MHGLDHEAVFARETHAIITQALHERGIDVITEDELEYMMRGMRGLYLETLGELRRMCGAPRATVGVRFRW